MTRREGPDVERVRDRLQERTVLVARVAAELSGAIEEMSAEAAGVIESGGTLFFCGNGGSAADAQHLAAEYIVRFRANRRALPAVALTTDSSVITAAGNDFGFEEIFARQIEALARPGDLVFLHSTSGNSANLLRAAAVARSLGVRTVALLARGGGNLKDAVDRALVIPTDQTAEAQELHLMIGHLVCERIEEILDQPPEGDTETLKSVGDGS